MRRAEAPQDLAAKVNNSAPRLFIATLDVLGGLRYHTQNKRLDLLTVATEGDLSKSVATAVSWPSIPREGWGTRC
jgi:hypothetical protein